MLIGVSPERTIDKAEIQYRYDMINISVVDPDPSVLNNCVDPSSFFRCHYFLKVLKKEFL